MGVWDISQSYGLAMSDRTAKWYADSQRPADPNNVPHYTAAMEDDQLSPNMRRAAMTNYDEATLAAEAGIDPAQVSRIRLITATILKKLDKAVLASRKSRKAHATIQDTDNKEIAQVVEINFSTHGTEIDDQAIAELLPSLLVNAQLLPSNESAETVGMYDLARLQVSRAAHGAQSSTASSDKTEGKTASQPTGTEAGTEHSTLGRMAKRIGIQRKSFSSNDGRDKATAALQQPLWVLRYDDH